MYTRNFLESIKKTLKVIIYSQNKNWTENYFCNMAVRVSINLEPDALDKVYFSFGYFKTKMEHYLYLNRRNEDHNMN